MLMMVPCEVIFLWIALYSAATVQGVDDPCSGAVEAVESAAGAQAAQQMVFTSMSSSSGKRGASACRCLCLL